MGYELWSLARGGGYYSFLFLALIPSHVHAISTSVSLGFSFAHFVRSASFSLFFSLPLLLSCRFILNSPSRVAKPCREAPLDRHTANPSRPLLLPSTSKQHLKFWHFREDGSSPLYCARTFLLEFRRRIHLAPPPASSGSHLLFFPFLNFSAEHSSLSCFVQGGILSLQTRDPVGKFPKKCFHKLFIVNKHAYDDDACHAQYNTLY